MSFRNIVNWDCVGWFKARAVPFLPSAALGDSVNISFDMKLFIEETFHFRISTPRRSKKEIQLSLRIQKFKSFLRFYTFEWTNYGTMPRACTRARSFIGFQWSFHGSLSFCHLEKISDVNFMQSRRRLTSAKLDSNRRRRRRWLALFICKLFLMCCSSNTSEHTQIFTIYSCVVVSEGPSNESTKYLSPWGLDKLEICTLPVWYAVTEICHQKQSLKFNGHRIERRVYARYGFDKTVLMII